MIATADSRLAALVRNGGADHLSGCCIGLEKESLRVSAAGKIASTPHPKSLGSALTHATITTDYSEALLEFITPPLTDISDTLDSLKSIHRFVYEQLGDELLWATSMPCKVQGDANIPIANYGTSNVGLMKNVYRRGLGHRYGRIMQTISGVHFNFSLPPAFWPHLQAALEESGDLTQFSSRQYFGLIRNFQRYGWIIPLLFGASPAVCKSFLGEAGDPMLNPLDRATLYSPYATSLRMSDIGYKNPHQAGLAISYDDPQSYVDSLSKAIGTAYAPFEAIGTVVDGQYRQLNANLLQIENEYYSFVRPKQLANSGERPTLALARRGVQYVEVRALDVNAFAPLGVEEGQLRFVEAFLLSCLLRESPPIAHDEQNALNFSQNQVAVRGRDPELKIWHEGQETGVRDAANALLDSMLGICEQLDGSREGTPYQDALRTQCEAIQAPGRLPSDRVLEAMATRGETFYEFAMRMSISHRELFLAEPLAPHQREEFVLETERSLVKQEELEQSDDLTFADYLEHYFSDSLEERQRLRPSSL